jgi:hypothetical protein
LLQENNLTCPEKGRPNGLPFSIGIGRTFSAILLGTLLFSCGSKSIPPNQLQLFNGAWLQLDSGEKVLPAIDTTIDQQFSALFRPEAEKIPLFRVVEGNNYRLYIGLPVRTSIARMSRYLSGDTALRSETDSTTYVHRLQRSGTNDFLEYVTEAGGSEIALFFTGSDSAAAKAFRSGILKNKIHKP